MILRPLKNFYQTILNKLDTHDKETYQFVLYDFLLGLRYWRIWYVLGMKDIKMRYKRSKFGQMWHILSTAIQITFIGVLWAYLFKMPVAEFFPYLAIGKVIYEYMAAIITKGSTYYYEEQSFLLEMPSPKSIYAYSNSLAAFAALLHDFVVVIATMIFFKVGINFNILYIIPAIFLLLLNSVWITIIVGYIGARFRDIPPLITSVIGVIMMASPIMWKVEQLPERFQKLQILNPFYVFIKISRDALLGLPANQLYWSAAIIITIAGFACTFFMLRRVLTRITFWV